ncbi:predicted protein [Nematostella vectensis]|uniref:Uncharacterized protein n=1 Tax=Nematostella vectensis TaxID=45351 RepID=A7SXH8_NEMVE|nr:predicted protein [Nematostella vectensis]|eukprot:XP_001623691.1 predicted protein [Nematostella vectensis]
MELISQAIQNPRCEVKTLAEAQQSKILQLQASLELKDVKLSAMTENYHNEKNKRKTAESLFEDERTKNTELKNSCNALQEQIAALEFELDELKIASTSEDPGSQEVLEEVEQAQNQIDGYSLDKEAELQIRCLEALKEQLVNEQSRSNFLEFRVSELEESLQDVFDGRCALEESFKQETEWLRNMLQQERELNATLSSESDRNIEELQKRVSEMDLLNCKLQKYKDRVYRGEKKQDSSLSPQDDTQPVGISLERDVTLPNLQRQLEAAHEQLALLRFGLKKKESETFEAPALISTITKPSMSTSVQGNMYSPGMSTPVQANITSPGMSTPVQGNMTSLGMSTPVQGAESKVKSPPENTERIPVKVFANRNYRIRIARLIWEGMANFQSKTYECKLAAKN